MQKFSQRAFLACLLAVLLAVPAGVVLWSHRGTTAYYENRALAERPVLTIQSLWDGTFGASFETWYSDHAPGRTTLLKADTAMQMELLHRPVVNGIITTQEVLLPWMEYDEWAPEAYPGPAADIAADLQKLDRHIAANGGDFYYIGFPEQRVYFADRYPADMSSHITEATGADAAFREALKTAGVSFLDMGAAYEAMGHPEEYYAAVDHHYNYYGAYAAYRTILETLAADGWTLPVLTGEDLEFTELPNPYFGSRNRKLYDLWPNTDRAVLGVQRRPVAFTRWDDGVLSDRPLFVLPANDTLPTSYNVYMGGDFGETVLKTDRPELPNALIFGDSFTNALETLLYASFDETHILDLRHYTEKSLKDYVSDYRPDVVLCIQNDTFYYTLTGNGAVWTDD